MEHKNKKLRLDDIVLKTVSEITAEKEKEAQSINDRITPWIEGKSNELRFDIAERKGNQYAFVVYDSFALLDEEIKRKSISVYNGILDLVCKIINENNEGGKSKIDWFFRNIVEIKTSVSDGQQYKDSIERLVFEIVIAPVVYEN